MNKRCSLSSIFRWLAAVLIGAVLPLSASADALLDSTLKKVWAHDFVSYFGFEEKSIIPHRAQGLTEHSFYSKNWTSTLVLAVDRAKRVVHMKLAVPRPLIDDESVCTRGRDIVKSFVLASAIDEDVSPLDHLADEIYVRGLDLHPIKAGAGASLQPLKAAAKTNLQQAQSTHMQAYKIGKGPLTNGDNAIFLSSIPKLAAKESDLFAVFIGKRARAEKVLQNCRISFSNEMMPGSKSMRVLWCETWDENFWKSISPGAQKSKI